MVSYIWYVRVSHQNSTHPFGAHEQMIFLLGILSTFTSGLMTNA